MDRKSHLNQAELNNTQSKDLAFLASIINSSDDAIFSKALTGIITSWNPAAERVFGYKAEEVIGKHASMFIPQHLQKEEHELMELILQGKSVDHYETERIKKNGEVIYVSLIMSPIKDSTGNIIGASKISRDITERKKTEQKLADREEQFRLTLDSMLESIQIHDFDWKYTYVNDALVKLSHYTREELLGYTVMEKYPGIEQTELFKVMQRCMTERITQHFETEFVFPDKSISYFELSIQPVPQGIIIVSIDISKRKSAEAKINKLNAELEQKVAERTSELEANIQQLKESEEKFQKAFHASAGGISITRLSDSRYLEVNEAFAHITGYSKEELVGHTSAELGMIPDLERRKAIWQEVREQGSAKKFELTARHKSGHLIEIISSAETIFLKGEKYAINIIYDITDRKRAEEQLKLAIKELESFSYTVSHDLRAPVRAISGYARILEDEYISKLDAEGVKALKSILRNSKRMGVLIDDLLDFSRLGRKQVSISEIDTGNLVKSIMDEFLTEQLKERIEIDMKALPSIRGDYSLIRQVWTNLISNAFKYSDNKPIINIGIGAFEKDEDIVYYVRDNGTGFDMQYYDKLFGVFQRLHTDVEFEGTGIGLAIVHRIILQHKGKVWAESKLNEGACFYFSLPK